MKRIFTIIFLALSLTTFSQQLPTEQERISRIEDNMRAFQKEYTTGTWMFVAGALFTAINTYTAAQDDGTQQPALGIAGGIGIVAGSVLIIDSHKWLNVNKIPPKKK